MKKGAFESARPWVRFLARYLGQRAVLVFILPPLMAVQVLYDAAMAAHDSAIDCHRPWRSLWREARDH